MDLRLDRVLADGLGVRVWGSVGGDSAGRELPDDLVACLSEATRAQAAVDFAWQRRVLEHAESLPGEAEDRADVQRRLALLDWRVHHRFDEVRHRLQDATEGPRPSPA